MTKSKKPTARVAKSTLKVASKPRHKRPPASPPASSAPTSPPALGGKLGKMVELMSRRGGASLHELMDATGWQEHSIRGAVAGALKHRGFVIASDKVDGKRTYTITPPAPAAKARKAKATS